MSVSGPPVPAGFAKCSNRLTVSQHLKASRFLADAFDGAIEVRGLAVGREDVGKEKIRYATLLKKWSQ